MSQTVKEPKGPAIIGLLILFCSLVPFLWGFLVILRSAKPISDSLHLILTSFSIVPVNIYYLLPIQSFVTLEIWSFLFLFTGIIAGKNLRNYNNSARTFIVFISFLICLTNPLVYLLLDTLDKHIISSIFVVIIHLSYIVYLTRPEVKVNFA